MQGPAITAALDVPAPELAHALQIDANHDGLLDRTDIDSAGPAISRWLGDQVHLVAGGSICEPTPEGAHLRDDQLVTVRVRYTCPEPASSIELTSRLHEGLGDGHSTVVRATGGDEAVSGLLTSRSSSMTIDLGGQSALDTFMRFVQLGAHHIFTGYDHILFLLSLLLLGTTLRRTVIIATSFTAAHSITLSLSALGLVTGLSSRFIESAIALSIAWVAVENHLLASRLTPEAPEPATLRYRWLLTFAFGLIHGFGFATALSETGLPSGHVPLSLAAFNLGVEAGQVAIIAVVWPALSRVARQPWYRPRAVPLVSLGVFAIAVYWFVQRAFL